jgi:DNA-binding MarR family transcriptional regulator
MNPTMVSRIAATLGDAGLIERDIDSLDRRTAFLRPTAAGRRLRERIHRERAEALARHVRELRPAELKVLWRALPVLEHLAESLGGRAL